jgi:hypothetical protein
MNNNPSASLAKTAFLTQQIFLGAEFQLILGSPYEKCVFTVNRIKEEFCVFVLDPTGIFLFLKH